MDDLIFLPKQVEKRMRHRTVLMAVLFALTVSVVLFLLLFWRPYSNMLQLAGKEKRLEQAAAEAAKKIDNACKEESGDKQGKIQAGRMVMQQRVGIADELQFLRDTLAEIPVDLTNVSFSSGNIIIQGSGQGGSAVIRFLERLENGSPYESVRLTRLSGSVQDGSQDFSMTAKMRKRD